MNIKKFKDIKKSENLTQTSEYFLNYIKKSENNVNVKIFFHQSSKFWKFQIKMKQTFEKFEYKKNSDIKKSENLTQTTEYFFLLDKKFKKFQQNSENFK